MPAAKLPKLPFVLLGIMTVFTFGGPLAFGFVLRGGRDPDWPPDRPVEWWTLGAVSAAVAGLMIACIAVGLANTRQLRRARTQGTPEARP